MSKLFQKIKRWVSGITSVLLIAGILVPTMVGAEVLSDTVTVETMIVADSTPELRGTMSNLTDTIQITVNGITYDAVNNGDETWTLPDNTITVALPDAVYDVKAVTGAGATDTTTSELTVEAANPVLEQVQIASDNVNPEWAKVGDAVSLKFNASEVLTISAHNIVIGGSPATMLKQSGLSYVASRVMVGADIEGAVSFSINYADLALNYGDEVTTTTDSSTVTFDKTAPELFANMTDYLAKYPPVSQELTAQNYLDETDMDPIEGVYVAEATKVVDVRTSWEIDKTKSTTLPVYKVTYTAEDQAGNLTSILKEMVLKPGTETAELGNLQPVLNGLSPLVPSVERGDTYTDEGVALDWRLSTSEAINVWVYGDLDLSKITIQDAHRLSAPYVLGYRAHDVEGGALDEALKAEREIDVEDTTGPAPVTGLAAFSGNGYVQLTWVNPVDEDLAGLDIYRSAVAGVRGQKVASALSATTKSFDDYTVVNGETYYYVVVAYDLYANASLDSTQVTANPVSPKIAATSYYDYTVEAAIEEPQDVKADETVEPDEDKDEVETKSTVPVIGIIILILLILLGLYLLYLQNPEMFGWLAFWKRNKKGSITLGALKKSKTTKTNTKKPKTKK